MSSMRFVHAADIHLDSPLQGLRFPEEAPVQRFRAATRRALENLVALCREAQARVLLIAGDLYDGDWKDYQTGLFFARQMSRLRDAGVEVVLVRGNHDAASVLTKRLSLPDNVRELPSGKAGTVTLEPLGLAIHGQSYPKKAVTEDLSANYPPPVSGVVNIGLLHTSAGGRPGHENYAPCGVEALANHGYDYWALGHVHQREILSRAPWIVFSGNTQGRHARETGAKGAYVVRVADGHVLEPEFHATDEVRWARAVVDLSSTETEEDVVPAVHSVLQKTIDEAEGRLLAVRVRVDGRSPVHADIVRDRERWENEIREAAIEAGGDDLWIEKIEWRTRAPLDLDSLRDRAGPIGELLRGVQALRESPEEVRELSTLFADLRAKLPRELLEGPEPLDPTDPATLVRFLDEGEQVLVARLLEEEEER